MADKSKSGIDNLARAIGLEGRDALGWEAIAGYAVERTAMNDPQRPGVLCAPGEPSFDEKAADELANATQTDASDWGYPTKDGIEVRANPQANAPVVDKLGLHLVRVLPDDSPANAVTMVVRQGDDAHRQDGLRPDRLRPAAGRRTDVLHQGRQRLEDCRVCRRRAQPLMSMQPGGSILSITTRELVSRVFAYDRRTQLGRAIGFVRAELPRARISNNRAMASRRSDRPPR